MIYMYMHEPGLHVLIGKLSIRRSHSRLLPVLLQMRLGLFARDDARLLPTGETSATTPAIVVPVIIVVERRRSCCRCTHPCWPPGELHWLGYADDRSNSGLSGRSTKLGILFRISLGRGGFRDLDCLCRQQLVDLVVVWFRQLCKEFAVMGNLTPANHLDDSPGPPELVAYGYNAVVGDSTTNIVSKFERILNGEQVAKADFLLLSDLLVERNTTVE